MVISDKIYTVDEFAEITESKPDLLLELIDGRIVEKVTSEEHGKIVINIGSELRLWLKQTPGVQGHYSTETTYRLAGDEHNERRPDVAFRLTHESVSTTTRLDLLPDFAVEIKSRSNTYDDLREKARYYLANGTRLVWLVYPSKQIVEVYFTDGTSELFTDDDTLSGGDVLPGFQMAVSDIFDV